MGLFKLSVGAVFGAALFQLPAGVDGLAELGELV